MTKRLITDQAERQRAVAEIRTALAAAARDVLGDDLDIELAEDWDYATRSVDITLVTRVSYRALREWAYAQAFVDTPAYVPDRLEVQHG